MQVVKRYEVSTITPSCGEDGSFLVVRLETNDTEHPVIDIRLPKRAVRYMVDQITD